MASDSLFFLSTEEVLSSFQSSKAPDISTYLLSLLQPGTELSRPPISKFHVSAVGLGKSGAIYLGVNLEFPGVPLYNTVHAEQFLVQNALTRGEEELECIALQAFPCGHCRQFLSELHNSETLKFVFLNGSVKEALLPEILPLRFKPQDLLGPDPGGLLMSYKKAVRVEFSQTAKERISKHSKNSLFVKAAEEAKICASKCYAPYSGCLSAVSILTKAGHIISGSTIENVAFNPTLPALQAAIINAISQNKLDDYSEITLVIVVEYEGRQNVNQGPVTSVILRTAAPQAETVLLSIQKVEG